MNAPIKIAQADTKTATKEQKIVKLTKPADGQAVTIELSYDQSIKVDFSEIANEKIIIVRIGERAVILFDNGSTVTLDPFFDSLRRPLANLEFEFAPGKVLTALELAGLIPFTDDQSVLPAAGEGDPREAGANFNPAIVEAIGPVVLNELMPPEELGPIDFTADIAPALTSFPPLAFAGLLAIVEEDHLTKKGNLEGKYLFLSEGNEGPTSFNHDTGTEDDFDNDPSTIDGDDDTWQNFDNTTHQFKAQLLITGGSGNYSFKLLSLPDFDTIYQSKGDTIRVHIDPVTGELVGYVDNGSNDFGAGDRVVFTLDLSPTGEIVFRIYDQLDHASLDGQPGDNEENNLVLDFSNLILVTDTGAGQSLLLDDIDLIVIDDVPVLTHKKEVQIVDEDDIKTFNDGLPGGSLGTSPNDGDGDGSYTGSPYNNLGGPATVFGTLAFTVKVGADEVYKKYGKGIAEFTFKDGDNTDLSYLYSLGLGSKGDDLRYDIQGNVLYGYAPNFNAGAVGYDEGIDRLVFKLTLDLDGDYKFELYDQLDHDAPNDFFIDGVSTFPGADENFDLQDSIFGDVVFIDFGKLIKASDYDGDSIDLDGQLKIAVRDDVPEVKECDPIILKVDEDDIKTNLSKGNHPEDGNSDGSYTGDPNNENGGPATVFGSLAGPGGVVVSGTDEPLTFSFAYNATNILQQLGLQSKGDELSYFVQNGVLYGYVNANLPGPFGPNDRIVFTFTLEDNGDFKFELFDQLDHDKPPYGADQNFDLQDDVPGDVYFIDFGKLINATDYDGDTVNLDNMLLIKIRDDIPEIKAGAKVFGVVEEEHLPQGNEDFTASPDLDQDHSQPGNDYNDTTNFVSGSGANSLLSLVNVGADEKGKFAFKSNLVNANIKTTGGADVTSGYVAVIVKSVVSGGSGSGAYQLLTAWNGTNDIFTLKVYANGNWEFTLLDQIDHHPFGSADNLEGFLELDFSDLLKFTDFDGDTIKLDGAEFYVKVIDDIPTLKDLRTSGKEVQHDETQGIQNPGDGDDDVAYASLPTAIQDLFDDVNNPGSDPDVNPKDNGAIGYASSGGSIVSFTSSVGTDQPGTVDLDLILSSQGTFSGLYTTDGRNIYLYKEGDVIVGRYDQAGDGNTIIDANDPAAFAIAIGDNGTVYLVQWVSLKHNDSPNNHDESLKIADGKVKVLVTVTDSDGDKASGTVDISSKIRFDDDGPDTNSNDLVQFDDDDLDGGNPGGVNDNPNATPINATGTLSYDYGSDGPGTVLFTGASLPGGLGFSSSITGGGTILTISQNGTPVLKVTLTNTTSGEYEVQQLAAIKHPDGNNENNVDFTLNYRVTDGDLDRASGSLKINVDDDTPVIPSGTLTVYLDDEAATDTYGTPNDGGTDDQNPNIVSAGGILPHLYGADGAGSLVLLGAGLPAHDPGSLLGEGAFTQAVTGGGTLLTIYQVQNGIGVAVLEVSLTNTTDGVYSVEQLNPVFHPTPGTSEEEQTFNISYRVTDSDNDPVDGSFAIKVDDDTPTAGSPTSLAVIVDEEGLPAGNDGGNGDAVVPDTDLDGNEATNKGTLAGFFSAGADGLKSLDLALNTGQVQATGEGSSGTFGLKSHNAPVYFFWDATTGTLYGSTDVTDATTAEATKVFTVVLQPNGDYSIQVFQQVDHPLTDDPNTNDNDPETTDDIEISYEDNLTISLVYRVTDGDNDTASATFSFVIDDDEPIAFDPQSLKIDNAADSSGTAFLDLDQNIDDNVGTDQFGKISFANIVDGQDSGLKSGGQPIYLYLINGGTVLIASTVTPAEWDNGAGTNPATETIFTITLNHNTADADTYTIEMSATVDNGAGVSFANLSGTGPAGNPPFKIIESTTLDNLQILFTPINTNSVNSDSDDVAVGGQFIEFNTGLRVDFGAFTLHENGGPASDNGFTIGQHETVNGFKFTIDQVSNGTIADVLLKAYDANEGLANQSPINATAPNGQHNFADDSPVAITEVQIFDADGTLIGTATGDTTFGTIGVDFNSGTVAITGLLQGYSVLTRTAAGYDRIEVLNVGTGGDDGKFSLSHLQLETVTTGDPIDMSFDLKLTDYDGDAIIVSDALEITLEPTTTPLAARPFEGVVEEEDLQPSTTQFAYPVTQTGNEDIHDKDNLDTDTDGPFVDNITNVKSGTLDASGGNGGPYTFALNVTDNDPVDLAGTGTLQSGGQNVLWHQVDASNAIGYVNTNGSDGYQAGDQVVFSLNLTGNTWTFTLLHNVDHPEQTDGGPFVNGEGTEENIEIDLGSVISVTDGVLPAIPLSGSITVIDDVPEADDDDHEVEVGAQNGIDLLLIVDVSQSMQTEVPGTGGQTRIDLARAALLQLVNNPNVDEVKIVRFRGASISTVWMDKAAAIAFINNAANFDESVIGTGGTNYDAALFTGSGSADNAFDTPPSTTDDRYVFFLSDGEPTAGSGISATEEANWITFLSNNNVVKSVAVGFGDLNTTNANNLEPIAWESPELAATKTTAAADDNVIIINDTDLSDLGDILESQLNAADGNVLDNDPSFGADGGYIKSILIDGVTYTFDGDDEVTATGTPALGHVLEQNGGTFIKVTTAFGGELIFYFADTGGNDAGDWNYTPPASTGDESFEYTLIDGDGDTHSANLNIDVIAPQTPPVANNDTVLTNITDFSQIVIPESALLYNDTDVNNDPLSITGVNNPSGGTVALGSAIFDPTDPPTTIEVVKTYNFLGKTAGVGPHSAYYFEVDPSGTLTSITNLNALREGNSGFGGLTEANYAQIGASDNSRWTTGDPGDDNDHAVFWAQFDITEAASGITQIEILVEGRQQGNPSSGQDGHLGIWNYTTSVWESIDVDHFENPTEDGIWSATITGNFADYLNPSNNQLTIALVNEDGNEPLRIDYVEVKVTSNQVPNQVGTIFDVDFSGGAGDLGGFTYSDGVFGGGNPADGNRVATGNSNAGALRVLLGGTSGNDSNMSGAWTRSFTLTEAATVMIAFDYMLNLSEGTDSGDNAQLLMALDGVRYGTGGNDYVAQLLGANTSTDLSTGWVHFELTLNLAAGTHSLNIGGFMTSQNGTSEFAEAFFDNVSVSAPQNVFTSGSFEYTIADGTSPASADVEIIATASGTITGSDDGEILIGRPDESDTLTGNGGADVFVLNGTAVDTITDYDLGDAIDISELLTAFDPNDPISDWVKLEVDGSDLKVLVDLDGGGDNGHVHIATIENWSDPVKILLDAANSANVNA